MLSLLLILLPACDDTFTVSPQRCEVRLDAVTPAAGAAGEEAVATGGPFTDRIDTALFLGATRAEVIGLDRTNCDTCDTCREARSCGDCGECPACGPVCETCTETVTFSVPATSEGDQELVLFNSHGSSNALAFTVQGETDTDPADTGGTEPAADSGQD
jgi:hypothetical protein